MRGREEGEDGREGGRDREAERDRDRGRDDVSGGRADNVFNLLFSL